MKIGIEMNPFSSGYCRYGDDRYKKIKEHGFSAVDFGMADTGTVIYTASQEESDAFLINEKRMAEEAGIIINQVHGPWRWPARDFEPEDRAERMEKMKKSIRATYVLGCKNWVIHPIMPFGVQDKGTENEKMTWDMNIGFMKELLKTAKEYGITICFENMPMKEFSIAPPEKILEFVKEMNDPNFKICLDTGHVSVFEKKLSLGEEVRRVGEEIKVFHIHDNKVGYDLHMMPYFGVIDWTDFSKSLKDINFDGVFSLETVPPAHLSDDLFEKCALLLSGIAKDIIDKA